MKLMAVPCAHYWLAVEYRSLKVIAICKFVGCQKRGEFTRMQWEEMKRIGQALDKPVRV